MQDGSQLPVLFGAFPIRHLLGKPSRNELARYIETQEPALREDLLSAIELGSNRSNPEFDSEVFRQLLQRDVASRIKTLDIEKTLPMDLIARWLKGSVVLAAVFYYSIFHSRFRKELWNSSSPNHVRCKSGSRFRH